MSKKDKKKKEKVELTATKASPAVASKKASDRTPISSITHT